MCRSIYKVTVGGSLDRWPLVYGMWSTFIGVLLMAFGFGIGDWGVGLGVLGILTLIGGVVWMITYIVMEALSQGSVLAIEYSLCVPLSYSLRYRAERERKGKSPSCRVSKKRGTSKAPLEWRNRSSMTVLPCTFRKTAVIMAKYNNSEIQ
jgi:hypothetical protein